MHLDEPVLVRRGAVDDDEGEVVVGLDLRPLPEALRVLDGERVEVEDVPEDLEVLRHRLLEVEPEEVAVGEQAFHRLAVEVNLAASFRMDDVAERLRAFGLHVRIMDRPADGSGK